MALHDGNQKTSPAKLSIPRNFLTFETRSPWFPRRFWTPQLANGIKRPEKRGTHLLAWDVLIMCAHRTKVHRKVNN